MSETETTSADFETKESLQRLKICVNAAGGPSEVSRKSGVPLGSLNHYIAGREMKLSAAVAIARSCGVSLEFLASGRDLNDQIVNIKMFQKEIWSAPAHFYSLFLAVRIAREYHDKMGLKPSLGELMEWISPVYIGQMMAFPDKQIDFNSPDDGSG